MKRRATQMDPDVAAARDDANKKRQAEDAARYDNWRKNVCEPAVQEVYGEYAERVQAAKAAGEPDYAALQTWLGNELRRCYSNAPRKVNGRSFWHGLTTDAPRLPTAVVTDTIDEPPLEAIDTAA